MNIVKFTFYISEHIKNTIVSSNYATIYYYTLKHYDKSITVIVNRDEGVIIGFCNQCRLYIILRNRFVWCNIIFTYLHAFDVRRNNYTFKLIIVISFVYDLKTTTVVACYC